MEQAGPQSGPLSGLLVADFSRVLAGPYATMLLADLGADVIKVESPAGDDTRHWVPPVTGDGTSTYFMAINRNKRSVALDLKTGEDLEAAQELARRADVFVENFKPGGLRRFGLDYETVSAGNPDIVYASISGFGSGQGKDLPGYDLMVQAMSGLMSLTGAADGPPFRAGISVFDVIAGLHTGFGILAALAAPRGHRPGPARRGEPDVLGAVRDGQPDQRVGGRRGGAVPDGQRAPQPVPLRAAAHQGRRADRDRGQRRSVRPALPGDRRAANWPPTRGSPAPRTAPPTGTSSNPFLPNACACARPPNGSRT